MSRAVRDLCTAFEWKPGAGGATALGTDVFNPANLLNQLTQVTLAGTAARSVTWDAAGNMTQDGVLTYVHDAENRLTSVTRTTPSLNASYTYDPLGRRVQRNVNGTSTFTLHDGDEEIAEYDATGALIRRFIPGPGTDEPIAIVVPASGGGAPERRFFHEDRIGNVIAMSGRNAGNTAPILAEGPFTYDAYGRSPQPLGTSATSTPFRYTGRRLDAETGNYYYRARFYTPTLGQFIETDPVGYADSLNLYAYVGGDPVNATDPSGMFVDEKWIIAATAASAADGPLPFGDVLGIGILAGAAIGAGIDYLFSDDEDNNRELVGLDTNLVIALIEHSGSELALLTSATIVDKRVYIAPQVIVEFTAVTKNPRVPSPLVRSAQISAFIASFGAVVGGPPDMAHYDQLMERSRGANDQIRMDHGDALILSSAFADGVRKTYTDDGDMVTFGRGEAVPIREAQRPGGLHMEPGACGPFYVECLSSH